jgi:hypothetical protein
MLGNSILKQDHINAVMKFLLFGTVASPSLSEAILTRLNARFRRDLIDGRSLSTSLYTGGIF